MGRVSKSENLRRGGRSPSGDMGEVGCNAVSLGSEPEDWETSEVCTTPCTTTSVPAAGKFRRASGGGGACAGSGGVAGRSITSKGSVLSWDLLGVLSG